MATQLKEKSAKATLEQMKGDPDAFFQHPNEVMNLAGVSDQDKRIILTNWFDYLDHLSDSEEEGMRGSESPTVSAQEINQALERLK